MERCGCGRDQRWGEAWCPQCGRRFGAGVPTGGPGIAPVGKPGTITAAQVLLILGAVGNGLVALFGIVGMVAAASLAASLSSLDDSGSSSEVGTLIAGGIGLVVWCVAVAAFEIWAVSAVGAGRRNARLLITLVPVVAVPVNLVLSLMMGSGAAGTAVSIVFVFPLTIALAVLLWLPDPSRRHFGDGTSLLSPATPMYAPTYGPGHAPMYGPPRSAPFPGPRPTPSVPTPSAPVPPRPRPTPTGDDDAVTARLTLHASIPTAAPATPPGGRHRVPVPPVPR